MLVPSPRPYAMPSSSYVTYSRCHVVHLHARSINLPPANEKSLSLHLILELFVFMNFGRSSYHLFSLLRAGSLCPTGMGSNQTALRCHPWAVVRRCGRRGEDDAVAVFCFVTLSSFKASSDQKPTHSSCKPRHSHRSTDYHPSSRLRRVCSRRGRLAFFI
ncbi:hypothetical protein EXIGLDRAFT_470400 [Exidia glandulosa HHB12029]|uniref:Uncharacterized protein n=1 Tax=Exidia glandulosa HHB12029 TaxID=1314781 RepID=A0A165JYS8_EXIGL|nr:hypothetical protein EXIGLDRAFT_470400 [Exidia glandulosa HHB12029]